MQSNLLLSTARALVVTGLFAGLAPAQGTLADYQRGQGLQTKARGLVIDVPGAVTWIGNTDHLWYSKAVKGGTEFVWVDAAAGVKRPAFDHDRLAAAISAASGGHYTGLTLPFAPATGGRGGAGGGGRGAGPAPGALTFIDNERAIQFGAMSFLWKCMLSDYVCTKGDAIPEPPAGGRGGAPEAADAPEMEGGDPVDGLEYAGPPPQQGDGAGGFGRGPTGCGPRAQVQPPGQDRGGRGGRGAAAATEPQICTSFDGKWEALIQNFNVFLRPAGATQAATPLSLDGSEGNYYTLRSVAWSPDSRKLVAYHTRPGYDRQVHYVESSPADQLQPKHSSILLSLIHI